MTNLEIMRGAEAIRKSKETVRYLKFVERVAAENEPIVSNPERMAEALEQFQVNIENFLKDVQVVKEIAAQQARVLDDAGIQEIDRQIIAGRQEFIAYEKATEQLMKDRKIEAVRLRGVPSTLAHKKEEHNAAKNRIAAIRVSNPRLFNESVPREKAYAFVNTPYFDSNHAQNIKIISADSCGGVDLDKYHFSQHPEQSLEDFVTALTLLEMRCLKKGDFFMATMEAAKSELAHKRSVASSAGRIAGPTAPPPLPQGSSGKSGKSGKSQQAALPQSTGAGRSP